MGFFSGYRTSFLFGGRYQSRINLSIIRHHIYESIYLAFRSSKKKTCWIKVTCFQRLAEITEKHLHKGARIAVIGTLDQQKWETDEGVQRSSFQLLCNSLEFIRTDGRGFDEGQANDDDTPF